MPPIVPRQLALLLILCLTAASEAQLRVATWNCAALRGDLSAIRGILAEIAEDDTPGWATPPAVLILQEVNEGDQVTIRNLLNTEVPGPTWRIATYTNSDSGGAQACLYRDELLTESVGDHRDLFTGAGRFSDRWRFTIDATNGSTGFWLYSCHLKASQGSSNEDLRESGTQAILNNIATLPNNANIIWGGDFNFYSNSEPGYELIADTSGSNAIVDPLGNGSWSGSGNAIKHTQSPRSTSSSGGLVGGGMDDRFDFVFSSQSTQDANGIVLIPGSYRSLGNDGQHYNVAINNGNNFYFPGQISRSNQLADALHNGADHLPVIVEFSLPAIGSVSADFDRVILGPNPQAPFRVDHTTPVVDEVGSSILEWTIEGSGGINGQRSGTTAVLGSSLTSLPVESSSVGPQSGTIFLDSPVGGTGGLGAYPVNWTCIRPAQASLSGDTYVPGGVVSASFEVSPEPVVLMRCNLTCSWMVFWLLRLHQSWRFYRYRTTWVLGLVKYDSWWMLLKREISPAVWFSKPEMKTFPAKVKTSLVLLLNCRLDQQCRVTSMAMDWSTSTIFSSCFLGGVLARDAQKILMETTMLASRIF